MKMETRAIFLQVKRKMFQAKLNGAFDGVRNVTATSLR